LIILKCVGESQSAVVLQISFLDSVPKVLDLSALLCPPNLLLRRSLLRVHRDQHTLIKQTICLTKVEYIKFDCVACCCVLNLEIEPLSMATCINVVLHQ
jgi:hypothetical protein